MTALPLQARSGPDDAGELSAAQMDEKLSRLLFRPVVLQEPGRAVHPSSWLEHVPFAFWIVDALRPSVVVELGTHSGNSYAAFAQTIQLLGLPAAAYAVDTWKGDAQAGFYDEGVFAEWAAYHDRHFSSFSRLIRSTFEEARQHFADGSVDLLHIDGYHTYESVTLDFESWKPKLSRRGLVLLHDINVRERDFGAWRLWQELRAQFPTFEFLHSHGLGVVAVGSELPEAVRWLVTRPSESPGDVAVIRRFFARLGAAVSAPVLADEASWQEIASARQEAAAFRQEAAARREELDACRADFAAQVDRLSTRLTAQAQHAMDDARRAARVEEELKEERSAHEEAVNRHASLTAKLRERVRDEGQRRTILEGECSRLRAQVAAAADAEPGGVGFTRVLETPLVRAARSRARTLKITLKQLGRSIPRFIARPSRFREAYIVVESTLFDEHYYLSLYPDVRAGGISPLAHFLTAGGAEGREPHPLFDARYYLRRNPDVAASGINPLLHYLSQGRFEGRSPHALFDVPFYLDANPDVRRTGLEPLKHFLLRGALEGRAPNPLFDCVFYVERYPDVGY